MEKKEVGIDSPVVVAGVTLIPVVKVSVNYRSCNGGISLFAVKQPVAVVLASPSEKRAFRITGEEVSLEELIQEVPSIEEVLEGI